MNWIIEQHKRGDKVQDIQVAILVKELNETWASDIVSWASVFKDRLSTVPKTNSYSAEFAYKTFPIGDEQLEVWKMKTNGEKNFKMFTITKNPKK